VQELKVNLNDHVQAGQMLAVLADHRHLYIEGRALRQEAKLLAQAAEEAWPIEAEFTDDERLTGLSVEFLGNTMDPSGMTLPVYVPFSNPQRDQVRQGKAYRTGAYRPGQKVLLKVTVEKLEGVIVVPLAAIVREGAETYVFRQNGPGTFDRRPVHVVVEDIDSAVIANDGSITADVDSLALNGAAALNRALKASQAEGGGGHHHHD
jgi:multidrug efflux pump subunit AcrA (membrane-fusion protein)